MTHKGSSVHCIRYSNSFTSQAARQAWRLAESGQNHCCHGLVASRCTGNTLAAHLVLGELTAPLRGLRLKKVLWALMPA